MRRAALCARAVAPFTRYSFRHDPSRRLPLGDTHLWSTRASTTLDKPNVASGVSGVQACVLAMLDQQQALLKALDDEQYVYQSPILHASVGQHVRHSLDHIRKPIEAMVAAKDQDGTVKTTPIIHYDKRARNTDIEHDRDSALFQIETIRRNIRAMAPEVLSSPVQGAFMLFAEGTEFAFDSTLSREMAFAVHHCIHHNALVKVLLQQHFPDVSLPQQFGMAPSTLNFNMLETSRM